ncbi:MAG: hypothetical protein IJ003_03835 [Candidatus Gastranaerophilales bacterium]|nr:hypothetical protein [Candidatus Gastranaerophilales bacterium]MBQ8848053.1 hypothetical protein [Candidatus Gastranaerophilales bacterium]
MSYVCKNCGKLITKQEYIDNSRNKGRFLLFCVIILCFMAVILIPVGIILLIIVNNKTAENKCPYCKMKDCIIPNDTPIAAELINKTYKKEDLKEFCAKEKAQEINKENHKNIQRGCAIFLWLLIVVMAIAASISK